MYKTAPWNSTTQLFLSFTKISVFTHSNNEFKIYEALWSMDYCFYIFQKPW